jgi:hypothetical protein
MASSGMLRRVALVRTDVSGELSSSCVRLLLVRAGVLPSSPILVTLMKEPLISSKTSVLKRATRRNILKEHHSSSPLSSSAAIFELVLYLGIE